jgi:hypothetical protein
MHHRFIYFLMIMMSFYQYLHAQELNLDMEEVDAYGKPMKWKLGHDTEKPIVYRLLADSVIKHSGRYSVKLFSNSAETASCFMQIALHTTGTNVILKGFLKTENVQNGSANLFMGLIGDSVLLQYDKMKQKGSVLTGTHDWQEFEISLPNSEQVNKINMGVFLTGTGTVWIDDLSLAVDDKNITHAPILTIETKDPRTGRMIKF